MDTWAKQSEEGGNYLFPRSQIHLSLSPSLQPHSKINRTIGLKAPGASARETLLEILCAKLGTNHGPETQKYCGQLKIDDQSPTSIYSRRIETITRENNNRNNTSGFIWGKLIKY